MKVERLVGEWVVTTVGRTVGRTGLLLAAQRVEKTAGKMVDM